MTDSASRTEAEPEEVATADAALAVAVWDWPVRIVHWALVALIAFSWWSAENERIEWHLRSGMAILVLLVFRILWGFLGSSTARFASFVTGPRRLLAYLRDPGGWRGIGHTPLGALSVIALLLLIGAQVGFGLFLSDENGVVAAPLNARVDFETAEAAHDIHEALFNVLLGFIVLHIGAIVAYRIKGKKLVGAMLTGRSVDVPAGAQPMVAAGPGRLMICLTAAVAVAGWIWAGAPGL